MRSPKGRVKFCEDSRRVEEPEVARCPVAGWPPRNRFSAGEFQTCSVCGYPFRADVMPSLRAAFLWITPLKARTLDQATEDANRSIARIVKEAPGIFLWR